MPDNIGSAQFNEMLEVGVDIGSFREGLRQLETAYTEFLSRINQRGGKGADIAQVSGLVSVNKQLKELGVTMSEVQKNLSVTLRDITAGIVSTLNNFEDTIERKFVVASKGRIRQAEIEADERIAQAKKIAAAETEASRVSRGESFGSFDGRGSRAKDFTNRFVPGNNPARFDEADAKAIADMLGRTLEAEKEKQIAYQRTYEEREALQLKEQQIMAKWLTNQNAVHQEALLLNEKFNQRTTLNAKEAAQAQQEIIGKWLANYNAAHIEALRANEKFNQATAARKDSEQIAMNKEFIATQNASIAAEQKRQTIIAKGRDAEQIAMNRQFIAQQKLNQAQEQHAQGWDRFTGRLFRDLPGLAAQVLRYSIAFSLIFGAINAVTGTIRAAFGGVIDAFKLGISYLTTVQDRAADIKEALLGNVVFSKQWAENVKLAGEAAAITTQRIQEAASKFGLDPEKIEAGFKSLIQGGGITALNNDLERSVDLTAQLLSALRSTGVSDTNQRRFVQEINDLMTGQVKSHNAVLRALGYQPEHWRKIRAEAVKNGTLYEVIEDRLAAVNNRLQTADERWTSLFKRLEQYRNVFLGVFAGSVWQSIINTARDLLQYLEKNKVAFQDMAKVTGEIVGDTVKFYVELGKVNDVLPNTLRMIGHIAIYTEQFVNNLVTGLAVLKNIIGSANLAPNLKEQTRLDAGQEALKKGLKGDAFNAYVDNAIAEATKDQKSSIDLISAWVTRSQVLGDRLAEFDKRVQDDARGVVNAPPAGKKAPPIIGTTGKDAAIDSEEQKARNQKAKDDLAKIKADFQADLENIRAKYQEIANSIKDLQATGVISDAESSRRQAKSLRAESEEILTTTKRYQGLTGAIEDLRKARKDTVTQQIGTTGKTASDATKNTASKDDREALVQEHQQALALYQIEEQEAVRHARYMLEIIKQKAAAGFISKTQAVDAERDIINKEFDFKQHTLEKERDLDNTTLDQKERFNAQLKALETERTDALKANAEERSRVQYEQYLRDRELAEKIRDLKLQEKEAQIQGASVTASSDQERYYYAQKIADLEVQRAKAAQQAAAANYAIALFMQQIGMLSNEQVQELYQKMIEAGITLSGAQASSAATRRNSPQGTAEQQLFGGQTFDDLHRALTGNLTSDEEQAKGLNSFGAGLEAATQAVGGFIGAIQDTIARFKAGKQQGGIAGGIGAVLSSGPVSDLLSAIPVVGGFVKPIGQILSFIGGLFKAAARRIAERMKREFDEIVKSYQSGNLGLASTIKELEAKRAEAIRKLSGKKGGKDELNKLLPAFDDEIAALKKQQKQITDNFEAQLEVIKLHDDTLQSFLKSWKDINKQVKEYLDAGGDINKANEFLTLNLGKLREDAARSLGDAEQEALQDAMQLNELLNQRNKLVEEFKQKEFDLLTADSIEKKQAGSVTRGRELAQARQEFNDQLANLDAQINLTTQKVELERTVFTISQDIAELHRRDEELQLEALQRQVDQWTSLRDIVNGIVLGPNGWTISDALAALINQPKTVTANINVTIHGGADADQIGDRVATHIQQAIDSGFGFGVFKT